MKQKLFHTQLSAILTESLGRGPVLASLPSRQRGMASERLCRRTQMNEGRMVGKEERQERENEKGDKGGTAKVMVSNTNALMLLNFAFNLCAFCFDSCSVPLLNPPSFLL